MTRLVAQWESNKQAGEDKNQRVAVFRTLSALSKFFPNLLGTEDTTEAQRAFKLAATDCHLPAGPGTQSQVQTPKYKFRRPNTSL